MRILLGSSLYTPNSIGGAEKVVQSLANAFVGEGHTVSVISTQPTGNAAQEVVAGVSVHYVPVRNLYRPFGNYEAGPVLKIFWRLIDSYNLFMIRQLTRILEREKPDVINTHNITGISVSIWSAAKRLGIPIVHTMHDQYLICHRSTMFKSGTNCAKQCVDCQFLSLPRRHLANTVDCAIGVSEFIADRHKRLGYFKNADSLVIYNKIQHPKPVLRPNTTAKRPLRFGFLGQLIPTKGVDTLVEAYLQAGLEDTELWIAGKGDSPYADRLRRATADAPNVRWLGFVRPEDFFTEIDVLVVPSIWNDTAPLVISEAMNYGIPVLASRRGGIPELMASGTGWMYEPNEPNALRTALQACTKSREQLPRMKDACLVNARRFISTGWPAEYLAAYQAAIDRHRRT